MSQLRIKTEQEFIEVFGNNWRDIIDQGWCDDMNHMFGRELTSFEEAILEKKDFIYIEGWSITLEMCTLNNIQNSFYSIVPNGLFNK